VISLSFGLRFLPLERSRFDGDGALKLENTYSFGDHRRCNSRLAGHGSKKAGTFARAD
jgi:hypothetical protein